MHSNSISERGTSTAIYEYAIELQKRGHQIEVAYDSTRPDNHKGTLRNFSDEFECTPYDSFSILANHAKSRFDAAYFIKAGFNDGLLIPGILNSVHSVFQHYEPHGDRYAYVSKWLASEMAKNKNVFLPTRIRNRVPNPFAKLPFVPHIVDLPTQSDNIRSQLGIPLEANLGVRYGGYDTFNIPWVKGVVKELLDTDPQVWFAFLNTEIFMSHPRVIYLESNADKQFKANFLSSSNFFLHAREGGETFGLALLEAMSMGIPVYACQEGGDRNHTKLLSRSSLYSSPRQLLKMLREKSANRDIHRNILISKKYKPRVVVDKFESVFLN